MAVEGIYTLKERNPPTIMKSKILKFCVGSLAILLLGNCTSARQKRIEANPQIYQSLTAKQQQEVQSGKISLGMKKEAVFLSWGNPSRIGRKTEKGRKMERWSYIGYESVPRYGGGPFTYGYGYYTYPYGFSYYDPYWSASYVEYIPYESRRVEFTNERVTEFREGHY